MKIAGNRLAAVSVVPSMNLLVNVNAFERSFAMQVAWPSWDLGVPHAIQAFAFRMSRSSQ